MTRATFHRLITQALSLLGATLVVLLLMNLVTNQRIESEKQTDLQKTLGEVLTADHYSQISLASYLEEYPSIQTAYKAYDTKGTALGYVIDVKSETETGVITTRMSFSPDGNTLIALRVLGGDVQSDDMLAVQSPDFYSQFSGVRVPAALLSDLPEQNVTSKEYPAIAGLTDGIFREQQQEEDEAGYKDFVELVVKGGRIVQVTWDAIQTDGGNNRAKASVDGEFVLSDKKIIWAAQAYAMQNELIEVQDPAKIAIKSDGTTEVVTDVTVSVNAFVTLANKCIEDSKNGLTAVSLTPADVTPAVTGTQTDESSADATTAALPTQTTSGSTAGTESDSSEETAQTYAGSEDGIVQNNSGGTLSDTIDGLPSSSIKTKINEAAGYSQSSRTVVSTVNQAYIFLSQYLKGGA